MKGWKMLAGAIVGAAAAPFTGGASLAAAIAAGAAAGAGAAADSVSNDIEEKAKIKSIIEEGNSIIESAEKRLKQAKKKAKKDITNANAAIRENHQLKIETLNFLDGTLKVTHNNFTKVKQRLERVASPSTKNAKSSYNSTAGKLSHSSFRACSNVTSLSILEISSTAYEKRKAEEHLESAKLFSKQVDKTIAEIKLERAKIKEIILTVNDEKLILESLLSDIKLIHPELVKTLSKNTLAQADAKKALFLGMALETYIDSVECNIVTDENNITLSYKNNIAKLKSISSEIKGLY
ncbi:hypothetical protein BIT28_14180 [Photobacterium proteolyticum]|uniref:Uncharacterized protein n=1 Tax=Photobacterium proteolyticum TaxID=1903952 RepID=A0A1Q9H1S0_9GAMM|nr:hypothetical protein [Photobacterium proteolyticum]OLQ81667.1 hypothetical protein BIT28_14180 [Photobacterium proteolyticum]